MSWLDKRRDGESPQEFAQRLHDETHGPTCGCLGNPGLGMRGRGLLPAVFRSLDTVPEGERVELASGEDEEG